ncbi:uncharacterized protein [Physcomitrium patens]|uniref:DUF393 domain-containing protein n=2 Tax=Physcomitrium patens TaxID=3218 RepID=A0A2K1JX70_PHYPA|nr:uncharacterized protein LOC112287250 isoform X1 [Physcomitrium patens]PNR46133.1 hypothetical protein PHYPA_013252 [Physcomitrium patens]|eukprot:XP_024385845.1 uncharacterized protein LOC112287250 isoform X1 [Physcomitrella patens]
MTPRVVSSLLVRPWLWSMRQGIPCTACHVGSRADCPPIWTPFSDSMQVQPSMLVQRYSVDKSLFKLAVGNLAVRSQGRGRLWETFGGRRGFQDYATTPENVLNLKPCVVIYDGVCHLCNAGVNWVIRVDKKKAISFCAVQSKAAEPYLLLCGVTREDVLRRFVFIEGPGEIHHASTAALKVASYLPFPYSALSVFFVIPATIRNAVYDYVAKRRYRWFGQSKECILPSSDVLDRFIDKLEIQKKMTEDQYNEQVQD